MSLTATLGRDEERLVDNNGKEWRLAKPTLGAMVAAERELRRLFPNPLRQAADSAAMVPPEHAKEYWKLAYAAEAEFKGDLDSLQRQASLEVRLATAAMLMLHKYHPEINTIEAAIAFLGSIDLARFKVATNSLMPPKPSEHPTNPPTGAD